MLLRPAAALDAASCGGAGHAGTGAGAGRAARFLTHFLDIPILLVIVSLVVLRPDNWTQFVIASAIAVAMAVALNSIVPRLYPWGGEEPRPPGHGGTGAELST